MCTFGIVHTLQLIFHPLFNLQLEAENLPEVSHKYEISAVPTFLLFKVRTVSCRQAGDSMFKMLD